MKREARKVFDAYSRMDHSGPCYPSEPCARCLGYAETEVRDLEATRALSAEPTFIRVRAERGHCFKNALRFAGRNRMWTIVHGIPLGRGAISGIRFAHAWNEVEHNGARWCYDAAIDLLAPAEMFYLIGAIEYTVRYSYDEAKKLVDETGHAGPWDDKVNSAE